MSNKRMCPIMTIVLIFTAWSSCPHSAWLVFVLQPNFQLKYQLYKSAILNTMMGQLEDGQALRSESCRLMTRWLFSTEFLPAMASNDSSMAYKLKLLKNRWLAGLAVWVLEFANVQTMDMGGAKSSLSIKRTSFSKCIFPYHQEW